MSVGISAFLFLGACTSTPIEAEKTVTGEAGSAEGQWRGRALLKNHKTSKSHTLSVDVLAREPSQLRMEVGGPFNVHVASVAMNGGEVRCSLTQQKRFLFVPADSAALARVVPLKIPPRALLAVLFERPLPKEEWTCDTYALGELPVECSHKTEKVTIKWLARNGLSRRIKIMAPETDVEMVLDEAKSKVQFNDDAFVINPT